MGRIGGDFSGLMTEKRYEKTFLSYSRVIAQFEILFEKDREVFEERDMGLLLLMVAKRQR